jgi:hypothetical protein
MSYSLEFPIRHVYPDYEDGITVVVFLSYGDNTGKVTSKLETASVTIDIPVVRREYSLNPPVHL